MNAGKRVDLDAQRPAASEAPLRKGLVRCEKCQRTVRPGARKSPHENSPECLAAQVTAKYEERGWMQVFNITMAKIIEEAGAPMEYALAGLHNEPTPERYDEFGRVIQKAQTRMVRHKVGFAPRSVIRLLQVMKKRTMTPAFRRRAILALWDRPHHIDALEALARMNGDVVKGLHQLVTAVEEEESASADQQT